MDGRDGYVYLIRDPENEAYKIGMTRNDPQDRKSKLQTANSNELQLIYSIKTEYPAKLERLLHVKFMTKRVLREWFRLDNEDVDNFKETCEDQLRIIEALKDNPFFNKDGMK